MPPRFITLAIVASWLVVMGWLFVYDLWPALRPGERAPFTIDLAQEATGQKSGTHWTVYRNGQKIGNATATITYVPDDGTYEHGTRAYFDGFKLSVWRTEFEVRRMFTKYRVWANGELQRVESDIELGCRIDSKEAGPIAIRMEGDVEDRHLRPRWSIRAHGLELPLLNQDGQLDPVELRSPDSILSPLQPWNRLLNVREKQTWRMTLFDPLADSLGSFMGKGPGGCILDAGVLEGTQELYWDQRPVPCLVIEYRGVNQDLIARTWVRQDDGLVLRQEAVRAEGTPQQERMALEREPR